MAVSEGCKESGRNNGRINETKAFDCLAFVHTFFAVAPHFHFELWAELSAAQG